MQQHKGVAHNFSHFHRAHNPTFRVLGGFLEALSELTMTYISGKGDRRKEGVSLPKNGINFLKISVHHFGKQKVDCKRYKEKDYAKYYVNRKGGVAYTLGSSILKIS